VGQYTSDVQKRTSGAKITVPASIRSVAVRVRLTKKLASWLNGLDVSQAKVGDVLELSESEARMMITEGWAQSTDQQTPETLAMSDSAYARRYAGGNLRRQQ
jgi:hypothetical protein